jgi:hypothetical protein
VNASSTETDRLEHAQGATPSWQKARGLAGALRGQDFWVEVGRPLIDRNVQQAAGRFLWSNLYFDGALESRRIRLPSKTIELLPEFRKSVVPVPLSQVYWATTLQRLAAERRQREGS